MKSAFAAGLLSGRNDQSDPSHRFAPFRLGDGGRHEGGDTGLHIARAAPDQPSIADFSGEGWRRPRLLAEWYDVEVPGKDERLQVLRSAQPRNHGGASGGEFMQFHLKTRLPQQMGNVVRACLLLSRRIERWKLNQLSGKCNDVSGLDVNAAMVCCCPLPSTASGGEEHDTTCA